MSVPLPFLWAPLFIFSSWLTETFSLDHQVFIYVDNCRAAPRGGRAEVTAARSLTRNPPATPSPRPPPTPTPLPGLSASPGKRTGGSRTPTRHRSQQQPWSWPCGAGPAFQLAGGILAPTALVPGLSGLVLSPRSRAVSLTVGTRQAGTLQALAVCYCPVASGGTSLVWILFWVSLAPCAVAVLASS